MSRMSARLMALLLGTVMASLVGSGMVLAFAPEIVWDYLNRPELERQWALQIERDEESSRRNKLILAELVELEGHEWAGTYLTKGRWPDELTIAPKAGWTLFNSSWCGTCAGWRGFGKVLSAKEDRLELEVEHGPAPGEAYALDKTLYLVPWGDLTFAVPEWRMPEFCAYYSDGWTFPRMIFRYLGDDPTFSYEGAIRPSGRPSVPDEYQYLILDQPIECGLVGSITWRPVEKPWGATYYQAVCSADAGSEDGLAIGMRLHRQEWPIAGVIESVTARTAKVAFSVGDDREKVSEMAGSRVSTRHPRAVAR